MKKGIFLKKYSGVKMNKYVPLLEKELKDIYRRKDDWMETALDLKEKDEEVYISPEVSLVILCSLLVIFNLGVLLVLI